MPAPERGFLRFEVGGQVFAISMADLAGIRQVGEVQQAGEAQVTAAADMRAQVAPTDLAELLFGEESRTDGGFILVVHAERRMVALKVDRVLPRTEAKPEGYHKLPAIIASVESPFTGMFWETEGWILVVDAMRLVDMIRQRYLDTITEYVYDIR